MGAQRIWQKKLLGDETWRRQESYRKWTFSLYRLCKKAQSEFSGSTDVVFPNSSIFIGSKNSPNQTKRKHEVKCHKANFILVLKSFHSSTPLPFFFHSTYSVFFLHLWQSQEEIGNSSAAWEKNAGLSQSVQWCEQLVFVGHWGRAMALRHLDRLQESFHGLGILEVPLLMRPQTHTTKCQFSEQSERTRAFWHI